MWWCHFFRVAELPDPDGILERPGENSRFARYVRFADLPGIESAGSAVLAGVREAVVLEESGQRRKAEDGESLAIPDELTAIFRAQPDFSKSFAALTPGRERGYLIHFSSARQSKTRIARIEKCRPKLFSGKGWNER